MMMVTLTVIHLIPRRLDCLQPLAITATTGACEMDTNTYEKGIKVTKAEMATLNLHRDTFHLE